jgi:uncharacterized protein YbjQ (UPF0145 family)
VILTSTETKIPGYVITAYKGIAQGETLNELLRHAEKIGGNAVLNTCFDDALAVETLFHGSAVVVKRVPPPRAPLRGPNGANSQVQPRGRDEN